MDFRTMQGTWPVIFISFAAVNGSSFDVQRTQVIQEIVRVYAEFERAGLTETLNAKARKRFDAIDNDMNEGTTFGALNLLCELLYSRYGKKTSSCLTNMTLPCRRHGLRVSG